jgi:hypothetical protein
MVSEDKISDVQLFEPREHSIILCKTVLGEGFHAIVADSDPYDAITYYLSDIPMATEFVGSYDKRLTEVRSNIGGFIDRLNAFHQKQG